MSDDPVRFCTVFQLHGKTATGFEVPGDVVERLGGGKRPLVVLTVGAHARRSSIAPRSGQFLLGVSAENRAAAGIAAGEELEVAAALDTAPREVEVPADLAAALAADPQAQAAWTGRATRTARSTHARSRRRRPPRPGRVASPRRSRGAVPASAVSTSRSTPGAPSR